MIEIEGLVLHFDSFKIDGFDIRIEEGDFHFLLGPTGSGKTVILESIMGLRKPKGGKIRIAGREIHNLPPEEREISYVPQDLALFPHLTVQENILFGIRARKLDPLIYAEYVQTLIEVTRVNHLLGRYPHNLSGGEKKRIALLRALAPKPKLLLLDEPLSGLDPSIKLEIQHLLKTLHSSFHPTTLCVTHDFEEAYFLGNEITICIDGRVEQSGRREDVFKKPGTRKVAKFLGARNLYRATVSGKEEQENRWILTVDGLNFSMPVDLCPLPLESGTEVDLYIRPEEVMIIREGKTIKGSLQRNVIEGEIRDIVDRGHSQVVYFHAAIGKIPFEISIPNYAFRNLDLRIGKTARIALREESLWIMPPSC